VNKIIIHLLNIEGTIAMYTQGGDYTDLQCK